MQHLIFIFAIVQTQKVISRHKKGVFKKFVMKQYRKLCIFYPYTITQIVYHTGRFLQSYIIK